MKTFFYNRTAYASRELSAPTCFLELDDFFEPIVHDLSISWDEHHLGHAENICRRMADIDLYAHFIRDAKSHEDPFWAATIIGSYLVGFFSACKSLLDAGAICLSNIHALALPERDQDLGKGRIWSVMERQSPQCFEAFKDFRSLSTEIITWRDASVHRVTPLVVVHSPGHPDLATPETLSIRMVNAPDASLSRVVAEPRAVRWSDPLDLHELWRPRLVSFCTALCGEVRCSVQQEPGHAV